MKNIRFILFIILLTIGSGSIYLIYLSKTDVTFKATFAPLFQLLGKGTKSVDRLLSRTTPVPKGAEKRYGEIIASHYLRKYKANDRDQIYIDNIMKNLKLFAKRKLDYRVFVIDGKVPNAYALPGGVIVIYRGLFNVLKSEAELVSILSHEIGHIELYHCYDAIKFRLLTKNLKLGNSGVIVDTIKNIMLRHSFSKTQENEADEYSFSLLKESEYDPSALGKSFESLEIYKKRKVEDRVNIVGDYFKTHPPTVLRAKKFLNKGALWWKNNTGNRRYVGVRNIQTRVGLYREAFVNEWITDNYLSKN